MQCQGHKNCNVYYKEKNYLVFKDFIPGSVAQESKRGKGG